MRWETILAAVLLVTPAIGSATATTESPDETPTPGSLLDALTEERYGDLFRQAGPAMHAAPAPAGTAVQALVVLSEGELTPQQAVTILEDVPSELAKDVDRLLIATAHADAIVDAELERLGYDGEAHPRARTAPSGWIGLAAGEQVAAEPAPPAGPTVTGSPDPGAFLAAQAILADAIEPLLEQPTSTELAISGCPVHEAPYLIICGEEDKTYAPGEDAILIVDTTGNDTYRNAQGTPFGIAGALPQIIVDAAGDDTYQRRVTTVGSQVTLVAQGAAIGGIGGIVDLTGDDRYSAVAAHGATGSEVATRVIAQGAAELGVGLLVDPAGTDCVQARSISLGGLSELTAQGAAIVGAGLAVLTGIHQAPGCPSGPVAEATARELVLPSNPGSEFIRVGQAVLVAQGAAQSGAGVLQGGPGPDTYAATARGGHADLTAHGAARTGVGLIHDPNGADTYQALGQARGTIIAAVSGDLIRARADAVADLGSAKVTAQGAALTGIAGHLDEGLGADTFTARGTIFANATAQASTTNTAGFTQATGDTSTGRAEVTAHGAAQQGAALAATATIGGDDRLGQTLIDAHSEAFAGGGADNDASATTATADAASRGQGWARTGVGGLVDAAGDDTYTLDAAIEATATATRDRPGTTSQTADPGVPQASGHAQADLGLAMLLDVLGDDTYTMSPGTTSATQDACWTNSPPRDTDIGLGLDALTSLSVPEGCLPPST